MKPKRVHLLGVPLDCVNMKQSLERVDDMICGQCPQAVIAINPEKIIKAQSDAKLLHWLHQAGLLIPDGIGAVVGVRFLTAEAIERVPGSELMPAICERSVAKGYKLFLFGARPEVNQKAVEVLTRRYPGIRIVGNQHGFVKDSEMPALVERINASEADVLFVALGSPRQELWMEQYLPQLNVKVCQGVGGTFDVIAGNVQRAPLVFRRLHLEWFYRLITNPKRLVRQTALPKFALSVLRQKMLG